MNLTKKKNGRWQVRWRDQNGRQRAESFRVKLLAQDRLRDLMAGKVADEKLPVSTFQDFATRWHRDYCQVEKAESQWANDHYTIAAHLTPAFGEKHLTSLTNLDLLALRANLKNGGTLKVKSINCIVALARQMLETAVTWRLIKVNPFASVKPLPQPEQAFRYWTAEERDAFLSQCRGMDPEFADAVEFTCHTGLRLGELLALYPDCIDLRRRVVIVRRSWCRNSGKLKETTKGKRIREVELNQNAFEAVSRALQRLGMRSGLPLFHQLPKRHSSRVLARLIRSGRERQVPAIKFHDLRHTFASHLAMAGVPLQKIQMLLGHQSMVQTMRYAHLHPSALLGVTSVLVSARSVHNDQKEKPKCLKLEWGYTDSNCDLLAQHPALKSAT